MSRGRVKDGRDQNRLPVLTHRRTGDIVEVACQLRGLVIGKKGRTVQKIKEASGADISNHSKGFVVQGSDQERRCAKDQILQIVCRSQPERLQVPDEFKRLVIGSSGQTLNEISTRTGARVFMKHKKVYVAGTEEEKAKARHEVQFIVAGGRLRNPNQPVRSCCFVDNFRLPQDCELCLVPDQTISSDVVPTIGKQYRLRLSEGWSGNAVTPPSSATNGSPCYMEELMDLVNRCLVEIRESIDSGHACSNDMWCHFGTVVIRDTDEEDAETVWTLEEAAQNLALTREARERGARHPSWRTVFREGVTFDAEGRLGEHLKQPDYAMRHDVNFLTPSGRAVRCKVWVRHEDHTDIGGEDDEIPFNDIKNILGEVDFKREETKARCKGWLCLPSTKNLRADIIFPACEFDCRLTLRTSYLFAKERGATEEKENKILLDYFSDLQLNGENLLFPSEKLPRDFRTVYQRRSKRTSHSFTRPNGDQFTVIVSREKTVLPVEKEMTDLHLHCDKWDKLLASAEWKPEEIIEKFPSFLNFVSDVQQMIFSDQEDQASSEN